MQKKFFPLLENFTTVERNRTDFACRNEYLIPFYPKITGKITANLIFFSQEAACNICTNFRLPGKKTKMPKYTKKLFLLAGEWMPGTLSIQKEVARKIWTKISGP